MRVCCAAILFVGISCNRSNTSAPIIEYNPPNQRGDTIDYSQLLTIEEYCSGFPLENKTLPLGLNFDMKEPDVRKVLDPLNRDKLIEYLDGKSLRSGFNFSISTRNYSFWGTNTSIAHSFNHDSLEKFYYIITADINKNNQQNPKEIDWLTISNYQNELMEVFLGKYGHYNNIIPPVFAKGMSLRNRQYYWFAQNRVMKLEIYNPQEANIFGVLAVVHVDKLKPLVEESKADESNRNKKEKQRQDSIDNRIKSSNI